MERERDGMPTYTVNVSDGCLDAQKKARIASAITRVHSETTGAPTCFAQVIFNDVAHGDYFVGGAPLRDQQVFVHGQIRGGRTAESKDALVSQMLTAVSEAAELECNKVWIYLIDIPARQMVEFGHVLPEPGDEPAWMAALPETARKMMQILDRRVAP
jgi:phenylpyruvate tautomerase PptA (4-oxalocrotonate tautomerase family)